MGGLKKELFFTKVLIFFSQKCVKLFSLPVDFDIESCILIDTVRNWITGAQSSMKSSLMKLNHVSTFSGKGQVAIFKTKRQSHF